MHGLKDGAQHHLRRRARVRDRSERGVTAVIVALVMVVLVGFAAIAVDVGALWWDKKQLQNGADAGALALAQSYAQGALVTDPDGEDGYATKLAQKNTLDLNATGKVVAGGIGQGFVTVQTDTDRAAWFSRIWVPSSHVAAEATARWGPLGGVSTLPITTSVCDFRWAEAGGDAFGKPVTIIFKDELDKLPLNADGTVDCSKGQDDGPDFPGGFGWLYTPGKTCTANITAGGDVPAKPGVGDDGKCFKTLVDRLEAGEIVEIELPVYDAVPERKEYHISGFVTLRLTAVCFTPSEYPDKACKNLGDPAWKQSALWISGTFVKRATLSTSGGGSAEDYGTKGIWLSWD